MIDRPTREQVQAAIDKLVRDGRAERYVTDDGQPAVRLIKRPGDRFDVFVDGFRRWQGVTLERAAELTGLESSEIAYWVPECGRCDQVDRDLVVVKAGDHYDNHPPFHEDRD